MTRRTSKLKRTTQRLCRPTCTEQIRSGRGILENVHHDHKNGHAWEPRYFVGVDESTTFRERIAEIHGDNPEMAAVVSQLDEYFSDASFHDHPEVQKFVGRVRRSVKNPSMADEIATEVIT